VKALLEAEVLEACLLCMPPGRKKAKVRAADIGERLRLSNPNYASLSVGEISTVIRTVFPVYKNPRSKTRIFKVCISAAEQYAQKNRIFLRPLEHATQCRIGKAIQRADQIRLTCHVGSRVARRKWALAAADREWFRGLVRVEDIEDGILHLYVPQWNPESTIRIPKIALPKELQVSVTSGEWLVAELQTDDQDTSRLRLRNFELSQEPDANDGLA
jgi:hypothetical protein